MPLLATKAFVPRRRSRTVPRPRLRDRLGEASGRGLTLVSAPAGFGKTSMVVEWAATCGRPVAWLSLDDGDADLGRFLAYLIEALRSVVPGVGESLLAMLASPQPLPVEVAMTSLVNDLAAAPCDIVIVLDDLHAVDSRPVDDAVAFLVEHLPPRVHLVIATREDPRLPLARLRARGEVLEVRAADLRFTTDECATFLRDVMDLTLGQADIDRLEASTEGWIAGLQLAAVSLRGHPSPGDFIRSFSGSHRFVLDYLLSEVLDRQTPAVARFLLGTSIVDRLSGPLCDAVTLDPETPGQETIEQLERANLFVVALDGERRWYRYHHLFRDLLAQRLGLAETAAEIDARHLRASRWHEENGLDVEAFRHAAAGHDLDRAERLIAGGGLPLPVRGALAPILAWLATLPDETFDARPTLLVTRATVLLASGHTDGIAEMLDRAETALASSGAQGAPGAEGPDAAASAMANIAITRSLLAVSQHRADVMIAESQRALALLPADALTARSTVLFTLGYAHEVLGDRVEARRAYQAALPMSRAARSRFGEMAALIGIGAVQELNIELRAAAATYEQAIQTSADLQYPVISEAYLGLARIAYEWDDLPRARELGARSLDLGQRLQNTDRAVASQVLLARVRMAEGDLESARELLAAAEGAVRAHGFARAAPGVADARVRLLLRSGALDDAAEVAAASDTPLASARVRLARGDPAAALAALAPARDRAEERGWADERLQALLLEAVAQQAAGAAGPAAAALDGALQVAEPGGCVRSFLDEGASMARLVRDRAARSPSDYATLLLGAFRTAARSRRHATTASSSETRLGGLVEPLTGRELELLALIAEGLSNRQIAERLFLSPQTVKVHARNIYGKLGAGSRTQAVATARSLGVLGD